MREIELKFQIPAAARTGVRRAVATASAQRLHLQARYFDTPDGRLAAAGLALRLRKEGRQWVQTLKSGGDGLMERGEHEVILPATRQAPALDVSRHAGTPAGAALERVLGGDGASLAENFATDVRRTRRQVRVAGGALIELALDEGEIRAGGGRLPVCELEFELLRGSAAALPAHAARWVQRHGLWLDPRSKAERGLRLGQGAATGPAVKAAPPFLDPGMDGAAALRAMLATALRQVLANACELADGCGTPEHLHQCRIGLRRLRCVLRDFAPLAGEAAQPPVTDWQERIGSLFGRFGVARDRDALREKLLPQLAAAGAPLADLPALDGVEEDPGAVLRERGTNCLWLEILEYVHQPPEPADADAAPPLRDQLRATLRRLRRRAARQAEQYATLDEAGQHLARKRLKRLRYGAEFCSSLYPAKAVARYLAVLRPAQDALGDANDLVVARALFEQQLASDPRIWFALGWLAARRATAVAQCSAALAEMAATRGFWRHDPEQR
jgi:inorganic triphosphatase YgiF